MSEREINSSHVPRQPWQPTTPDNSAKSPVPEDSVLQNPVERLTARQYQIMDMVVAGHPSKSIAADLGISQRTVENHRASIMKKTGSKSIPALVRLAIAFSLTETAEPRSS